MIVCTGEQSLKLICPTEDHGNMGFIIDLAQYIDLAYVSPKVKPSDKFLHKVSETFRVSLEWLMTGVGNREAVKADEVDDKLIAWLNEHPEIIRELRKRSGLD